MSRLARVNARCILPPSFMRRGVPLYPPVLFPCVEKHPLVRMLLELLLDLSPGTALHSRPPYRQRIGICQISRIPYPPGRSDIK